MICCHRQMVINDVDAPRNLRIREHPTRGAYAEGLNECIVTNYKDVRGLHSQEESTHCRIYKHEFRKFKVACSIHYNTQIKIEGKRPTE